MKVTTNVSHMFNKYVLKKQCLSTTKIDSLHTSYMLISNINLDGNTV